MSEVFAWIFPGGKRVVKTIAATAGNVATNLSPGTGKRWLLLFGRVTLVNDSTVATRYLTFATTDGTNLTQRFPILNLGQAKDLTYFYSLHQHLSHIGGSGIENLHLGIGTHIILEGADQLRISVTSGVAGDSYSGSIVVLEIDV